jgi:hypothetical protein
MSLLDQVSAGRPARRSAGWRDDDRVHRRKNWIAGGALALVLAAAGGAMVFGARESVAAEREPKTGCLVHSAPPSATLAFLDVTDPLAADSGQRFTNLVTRMRDDLPRDGRLTIVPFGGDLGVSLAPVFDQCSPGRGSEANTLMEGASKVERHYQRDFGEKVSGAADQLTRAQPSEQSPITAQLARVVGDPSIRWEGQQRTLVIWTDGLENTAQSPVYKKGRVILPPPPKGLLAGVRVEYVELVNPKAHALQTPQLRKAWEQWFRDAGAEDVQMYAAGYARPG